MTASSLSGLSTVLITLSLVAGCGSAKQIGYLTRAEQPQASDTRFEVTMVEPEWAWQYMDATTIYYNYQQQRLRPSRDYLVELRYDGEDSVAMKAESVVITTPQGTDTLHVSVNGNQSTWSYVQETADGLRRSAWLTLAHVVAYGQEPVDTINYSFELMLVHQDTTARLEGPIHFAGRAIKYRY